MEGIPSSSEVDVVGFAPVSLVRLQHAMVAARSSGKIAAAYFLKWSPPKHWHQVEGLSSQGGTQGERRRGESYSISVCARSGEREG